MKIGLPGHDADVATAADRVLTGRPTLAVRRAPDGRLTGV